MAMQAGQRVGPFDIEKLLGSGAMGAVYRARYRRTGRRVAIKIMAPGLGGNETALARFEREGEMLKQLNHPNIVRFYVASQFEGTPYYAMEHVEGEPLDRVFQRRGRLTWEELVEAGKQICSALQHAHDHGIIHRDLKPSNLMVMRDGNIKLTDFGIAKDLDVTQLTAANCTVGTAAYMSPEQCRGERYLTHKSDLYSLGVVLYELLTGRKPFQAETTMDMFLQHVEGTFERPSRLILDIPVWLDTLVCQLLEKKPEHRPFDAAKVAESLELVAEKVAALKSAGVDIAQAGRMAGVDIAQAGRMSGVLRDTVADEADKRAARTLLSSLRRGRRKRRGKPFYEKSWFQAIAISGLLIAVGAMLYQVFRPPSAEKLYQQAQKLMESKDREDWQKARDGPIAIYLHHYGKRADEAAYRVREWADFVDVRNKWNGLLNRREHFKPDGEAEIQARSALEAEEKGTLKEAIRLWEPVAELKQEDDPDQWLWGLLALKRIALLGEAQDLEAQLQTRCQKYLISGEALHPQNYAEKLALDAVRYENFGGHGEPGKGDRHEARSRWLELKNKRDKYDLAEHARVLLAAKKVHDWSPKSDEEPEDVQHQQIERIKAALEKAKNAEEQTEARALCTDIIDLYERKDDAEIKRLVTEARELLKQLPMQEGRGAPSDNP